MKQKLFMITIHPKAENNNWQVGEALYNKKQYNILFQMESEPSKEGINGGRIIRLEIEQNRNLIYVYHKGWKKRSFMNEYLTLLFNIQTFLEKL